MDLRKDVNATLWLNLMVASTMACIIARLMAITHGAPLSSVTIWNDVGEPIVVHCRDQFTDRMPQKMPHASDYIFTFYQNPDGTTLYTCSFVWGLNKTQEFPVWEGAKVQVTERIRCGDGTFKCLYRVTKEGFYVAAPVESGMGGLSNWAFFEPWVVKSNVK